MQLGSVTIVCCTVRFGELYGSIRRIVRCDSENCTDPYETDPTASASAQMVGSSNDALFPCDVCGVQFSQERHLLRHFRAKKHLEMKDIMERAAECSLEESEAAMDESVSEPDSRDPSTMVEEGGHDVDSDSDVDSKPDQQGFDPVDALVDVPESA